MKTILIGVLYDEITGNPNTYSGVEVVVVENQNLTKNVYNTGNWLNDWGVASKEIEEICVNTQCKFEYQDSWYTFSADSHTPSPRYFKKIFGEF